MSIENIHNSISQKKNHVLAPSHNGGKESKVYTEEANKKGSIYEAFNSRCGSGNTSGFNSSRFQEHIQDHLFRKEKKIQHLKEQLENVEMRECTFSPNTHRSTNKEKTPKRNLNEFLKSQNEYIEKVEKKKSELKKQV